MNVLVKIADNPYVRATAIFVTIAASVLTVYHLIHYQMPLSKINLEKAQKETVTV